MGQGETPGAPPGRRPDPTRPCTLPAVPCTVARASPAAYPPGPLPLTAPHPWCHQPGPGAGEQNPGQGAGPSAGAGIVE